MRDEFDKPVRTRLAGRVAYACSNPDCEASTLGPATGADGTVNLGVAAHITAASKRGPRYDTKLTPTERRSIQNGIWLCQTCGKAVDSDESAHTVQQLRQWKLQAEQRAKGGLGVTKTNSHFQLLPEDQTMYINLRRFEELAQRNHLHPNVKLFPRDKPLLEMGGELTRVVMEFERVLKILYPEALRLDSLKQKRNLKRALGQLVQFEGYFRSKNAPRLRRDGSVPVVHPSGDLNKDHIAYMKTKMLSVVLPLDSLWFASRSSVGFFRGTSNIPIRGLARVHSFDDRYLVASPLWLALPARPISRFQP